MLCSWMHQLPLSTIRNCDGLLQMRSKMSEAEMHALASPNALYGTRTAGKAWDSVDLQGNDDEFHSPAGSRRVSTT